MPTEETTDRDGVRQLLLHLHDEGHPIDAEIAEIMGAFATVGARNVWFQRQEAQGNLKCVGTRKNKQGRKVLKVYCSWQPKEDNLRHEVMGTRYRILYPLFTFERGHRIGNCYPDLVQRDGSKRWEIEADCDTIKSKTKFQQRIKQHKDCDCDVLVVIASKMNGETRLRTILEWIDGIRDGVFVTTIERLEQQGQHERVWDFAGRGEQPLKRLPYPVHPSFQAFAEATPQTATGSDDASEEVTSD